MKDVEDLEEALSLVEHLEGRDLERLHRLPFRRRLDAALHLLERAAQPEGTNEPAARTVRINLLDLEEQSFTSFDNLLRACAVREKSSVSESAPMVRSSAILSGTSSMPAACVSSWRLLPRWCAAWCFRHATAGTAARWPATWAASRRPCTSSVSRTWWRRAFR